MNKNDGKATNHRYFVLEFSALVGVALLFWLAVGL